MIELTRLLPLDAFVRSFRLQVRTQRLFYRLAMRVAGPDCPLAPLPDELLGPERNFFSTFFLAVTRQMIGRPSHYMPLYAMVNQAMRAWVTACDNILDDEYKEVLPFAFVGRGPRMRSILTLLIADRVLSEYVAGRYPEWELLKRTGRISLAALLSSAMQECEEEARSGQVLPPQIILSDIHQRKTGDLFCAPLALPEALEEIPARRVAAGRRAVEQFGLACQILDDLKDLPTDLQTGRHNLLASLAVHQFHTPPESLAALRRNSENWHGWQRFPDACAEAWQMATERFGNSFDAMAELDLTLGSQQRQAVVLLMYRLLGLPAPAAGVPGAR